MKYWIISKEDEISSKIKEKLINSISLELSNLNPDIVIVVGGDGTFISAVHSYPKAIFFGVHTGHLGFYSNYVVEDLDQLIQDIHAKDYQIEELDILHCTFLDEEKEMSQFALNEMTIFHLPKTLIADVYIDDKKLETFRGTGLCISTSYGSTAYNKSLNGAVVDPNVKAFQMTEIAGINSNAYRTLSSPLLLSSERSITIVPKNSEKIFVNMDHLSYNFSPLKSVKIQLILKQILLAKKKDIHFVSRIKRTFLMEK